MNIIKTSLLSFILLFLSSCIIHTNDVEGEVDLVYSDTITISANDFVDEDDYTTVASYGWNNLDEYVVDQGLVLGYLQFEGTTAWHALPFTVPFEDDVVNMRYLFDVNNFSLVIEGELSGNNAENAELFHGDVLRIIAIPPSEIVQAKGLNYRDYNQVSELYGLDE